MTMPMSVHCILPGGTRAGLLVVTLAGCGPQLIPSSNDGGGDGTTTSEASGDTTATPPPATSTSGTGDTSPSSPTPATDDTTGFGESGADDASFLTPFDMGESSVECDPFTQDCPPGQKCTFTGEGSSWDGLSCVPLADEPANPGEPCTMEDSPVSGLDNCRLGAMCWDVDIDTLEGSCIDLCTGSYENPTCDDPQSACAISGSGLALCLPTCNPLQLDDCPEGRACFPSNDRWNCFPDASDGDGAYGDPCEYINACDSGLVCLGVEATPDCQGSIGCCTEVCDLEDPQCMDTEIGVTCTPWWGDEEAPPGFENVGVCALPED